MHVDNKNLTKTVLWDQLDPKTIEQEKRALRIQALITCCLGTTGVVSVGAVTYLYLTVGVTLFPMGSLAILVTACLAMTIYRSFRENLSHLSSVVENTLKTHPDTILFLPESQVLPKEFIPFAYRPCLRTAQNAWIKEKQRHQGVTLNLIDDLRALESAKQERARKLNEAIVTSRVATSFDVHQQCEKVEYQGSEALKRVNAEILSKVGAMQDLYERLEMLDADYIRHDKIWKETEFYTETKLSDLKQSIAVKEAELKTTAAAMDASCLQQLDTVNAQYPAKQMQALASASKIEQSLRNEIAAKKEQLATAESDVQRKQINQEISSLEVFLNMDRKDLERCTTELQDAQKPYDKAKQKWLKSWAAHASYAKEMNRLMGLKERQVRYENILANQEHASAEMKRIRTKQKSIEEEYKKTRQLLNELKQQQPNLQQTQSSAEKVLAAARTQLRNARAMYGVLATSIRDEFKRTSRAHFVPIEVEEQLFRQNKAAIAAELRASVKSLPVSTS